jgi:hypothetical protein
VALLIHDQVAALQRLGRRRIGCGLVRRSGSPGCRPAQHGLDTLDKKTLRERFA